MTKQQSSPVEASICATEEKSITNSQQSQVTADCLFFDYESVVHHKYAPSCYSSNKA